MAIVVLENLQPSRDIRCVSFASLLVQFEIGAPRKEIPVRQHALRWHSFITPALAA
jgi:hypothetical protein